jgi:feruloyl esterase
MRISIASSIVGCAPALADGAGDAPGTTLVPDFEMRCTAEAMQTVASKLAAGVTIKQIPNGPQLPGGARYVPPAGKLPAFCQVTGNFVTNPQTAKTANFIATFPARWNGKYLQLGCSGVCGYLLMNDPAAPPITVTAQGYPGQLIQKGYATFGNDLGHVLPSASSMSSDWLKRPDGSVDVDALDDYLYRADRVMADVGKAFTRAFYGARVGKSAKIEKSYFMGCSQGGREALIAATRFPEQFDGVIAGSPVSNLSGPVWANVARGIAAQQPGVTKLTPGQIEMLKGRMIAQCDAADGVKDGLIQNPAMCGFNPAHDLPICEAGHTGDSCVSQAQAQLISAFLAGATDDAGKLVQPGYALIEPGDGLVAPVPSGIHLDADLRFIVGNSFDGKPLLGLAQGGPGTIDAFHVVVNGAAYKKYYDLMRPGTVEAEDFSVLLKSNSKLLWYHNLSDPALTPYMSINRYLRVAELNGGFGQVQKKIRLFTIPSTGHCGMGGDGPSNFDAIGALEDWVEHDRPPNALTARRNDPAITNLVAGQVDWSKPAIRTMPLCAFPQMARYKGGDVNVASNWECNAADTRMLNVGVSGKEAGVIEQPPAQQK